MTDIYSDRMVIKISDAKGEKDRYVQLSQSILLKSRKYYNEQKSKIWLFEGMNGGKYSPTSVLNVVKKAVNLSVIHKKVTPHTLRHSYIIHHLEMGTDLRYIQEWLGHNNIKTTEIYTHVSERNFKHFKNPLDELENNLQSK